MIQKEQYKLFKTIQDKLETDKEFADEFYNDLFGFSKLTDKIDLGEPCLYKIF